jgi:hypothetical protein
MAWQKVWKKRVEDGVLDLAAFLEATTGFEPVYEVLQTSA